MSSDNTSIFVWFSIVIESAFPSSSNTVLVSSSKSKDMGKSVEQKTSYLENIADVENDTSIQFGSWNSTETQIDIDIYDAKGDYKNISTYIEKLRDGKFNIKFLPDANTKPGFYNVVTTFIVDGQEYTVESEFAWGLVSLNTDKSTYHPGEQADFVIVVLDNEGHPVCDANLSMNILNPNLSITSLISGNGITVGQECGLYDAEYTTTVPGTYNVDIHAAADGIDTDFETSFAAADFYELFDFCFD